MRRFIQAAATEVLIYPALIVLFIGLYAADLPGIEIVGGLAIAAIIFGIARGLWMWPEKLRFIWSKSHG